jgi:hypothetical protein
MDDKTRYPHQNHKLRYHSDFHFLQFPLIYYIIMHKFKLILKIKQAE